MGGAESILHVHTVPVISGSGINTLLSIQGAINRGHDVALVTECEGALTEEVRHAGARVFLEPAMGREVRPIRDLRSVVSLEELLRREAFSIVHTHNSKAGFIGRLAARRAGGSLVIHTVHGFSFHQAESWARRRLFRRLERLAGSWCDGMIFVSQALLDWAKLEGVGQVTPRTVIYSGIDIEAFESADPSVYRARWNVGPEQIVVGVVSKLWVGKGHGILLDAWRRVLDMIPDELDPLLVVVGEGPMEAKLKSRAHDLGLDGSVLFTGFLRDVPEVTAALDVAVLPSLFEGMGRVILEALAAGKPVVASRVGGIPELITHDWNGMLADPGDTEALAAMLRLVVEDSDTRKRLAGNTRPSIGPEHSSLVMVERIHAFYDKTRSEHQGTTAE